MFKNQMEKEERAKFCNFLLTEKKNMESPSVILILINVNSFETPGNFVNSHVFLSNLLTEYSNTCATNLSYIYIYSWS